MVILGVLGAGAYWFAQNRDSLMKQFGVELVDESGLATTEIIDALSYSIDHLEISRDKSILLTVDGEQKRVQFWKSPQMAVEHSFEYRVQPATAVLGSDLRTAFVLLATGELKKIEIATGNVVRAIETDFGPNTRMIVSPSQGKLALVDESMTGWVDEDLSSQPVVRQITQGTAIACIGDHPAWITCHRDGRIRRWSFGQGSTLQADWEVHVGDRVFDIAGWDAGNQMLALIKPKKKPGLQWVMLDAITGDVKPGEMLTMKPASPVHARVADDGTAVIYFFHGVQSPRVSNPHIGKGELQFWDLKTKQRILRKQGRQYFESLTFTRDGDKVLVGTAGGRIKIFRWRREDF